MPHRNMTMETWVYLIPDALIQRLRSNKRLSPQFSSIDRATYMRMMGTVIHNLMCKAPVDKSLVDRSLIARHSCMGLTREDVEAWLSCLGDALSDVGVTPDDQEAALAAARTLCNSMLHEPEVKGHCSKLQQEKPTPIRATLLRLAQASREGRDVSADLTALAEAMLHEPH